MSIMGFFGRDARRPQHEALESIVGASASVSGHLRSDGGVRIDGIFEGVIEVAGNVVIGEGARVVANITARNVTVGGAVKGNVDATGRLEILTRGQVFGDIMVAQVMIDDGGVFQGNSRMRGVEQRALQAPGSADAGLETNGQGELEPTATSIDVEARVAPDTVDAVSRPVPDTFDDDLLYDEADDIEPIIPDIVIEEPRQTPPTSSKRRATRSSRGR